MILHKEHQNLAAVTSSSGTLVLYVLSITVLHLIIKTCLDLSQDKESTRKGNSATSGGEKTRAVLIMMTCDVVEALHKCFCLTLHQKFGYLDHRVSMNYDAGVSELIGTLSASFAYLCITTYPGHVSFLLLTICSLLPIFQTCQLLPLHPLPTE